MRIRNVVIAALLAVLALGFSVPAQAEVEKSGGFGVDWMSQYVWRGLQLSDEWVFQPYIDFGYGPASFNFWANWDSDTEEMNETDLTLNYTYAVDKLSFDVGYIYYSLDSIDDTMEFYVAGAYDFILSPSLTVYWDVDEGGGFYIVLAADYSRELAEQVTFDFGISAGYLIDNKEVGVDAKGDEYSDFHDFNVNGGLTYAITDELSIGGMVAYAFALSDDAEDAMKSTSEAVTGDREDDVAYGGVSLSLAY
jgi:hypothetical protein